MSDESTLLIAFVGGIGGALLAGIFQAFTSAWSQRRQERHELDTWLREQRLAHLTALIEKFNSAAALTDPESRRALADDLHDASIPLRIVAPHSLEEVVEGSVELIIEELRGEFSIRSGKAISWQNGYMTGRFKVALGWGQESLRRPGPAPRLRVRIARLRRRLHRARSGEETSGGEG